MNNNSEFQVNIFSNNRDIRLHLENSKSQKGHNFVKKIGGLPPLLVWVPLLIVNNYSEFQVNIFSNNRDVRLHLENSKSKKGSNFFKKNWRITPLTGMGSTFKSEQHSEFQVNIFSNNRDIRKWQSFCTTPTTTTPPPTTTPGLCHYLDVFVENSRANNEVSDQTALFWDLGLHSVLESVCPNR